MTFVYFFCLKSQSLVRKRKSLFFPIILQSHLQLRIFLFHKCYVFAQSINSFFARLTSKQELWSVLHAHVKNSSSAFSAHNKFMILTEKRRNSRIGKNLWPHSQLFFVNLQNWHLNSWHCLHWIDVSCKQQIGCNRFNKILPLQTVNFCSF